MPSAIKTLRVAAAAAVNTTPLDWMGNLKTLFDAIGEAKRLGVEMLLLPEFATTGYGCEDGHFLRNAPSRAWENLRELAAFSLNYEKDKAIAFAVGLLITFNGKLYNGVAVVVGDNIVGIFCKQNLANDGIHYESRWFTPWPAGVVSKFSPYEGASPDIPIGDIRVEINGVRYGFEVCEDMFVANRLAGELAYRGIDVILNPSASHFAFGKCDTRRRIVEEGSRLACCTYAYSNLLGNEA